jgi:hypothetical protein
VRVADARRSPSFFRINCGKLSAGDACFITNRILSAVSPGVKEAEGRVVEREWADAASTAEGISWTKARSLLWRLNGVMVWG